MWNTRVVGLVASAVLWMASMFLPGSRDEGPPRSGVVSLLLGGYFLAGLPLTAANLCMLWSWIGLALHKRRHALWSGLLALALSTLGAPPLIMVSHILEYPAYWTWLLSIAIAVVSASAMRNVPTGRA